MRKRELPLLHIDINQRLVDNCLLRVPTSVNGVPMFNINLNWVDISCRSSENVNYYEIYFEVPDRKCSILLHLNF